jgi:hypothetical protein
MNKKKKKKYRYKRYWFRPPKALGEILDAKVDYNAKLIGPAIVFILKGLENSFSWHENFEKPGRENRPDVQSHLTDSIREDSRILEQTDLSSPLRWHENDFPPALKSFRPDKSVLFWF